LSFEAGGAIAAPHASEVGHFLEGGDVRRRPCAGARPPGEFVEIGELAACIEFMRGLSSA
jgi:hypothetical protein